MAYSTFKPSYTGIGEMLRADFVKDTLKDYAERVKVVAIATAPKRTGHYAESFEVSTGEAVRGGGLRAYARVTNTASYAIAVEYGFGNTPKHHTLANALHSAVS